MPTQEALWRSIYFFNLYRLILGGTLVFLAGAFGSSLSLGARNLALFYNTSFVYVVLALAAQLAIKLRRPPVTVQLPFLVGADIVCITLLSHASGGIQSSLGMLLLVSLAAAGLISRGKTTLFFAALASIAVLLEHSYSVLAEEAEVAQYLHAGLLSVAYFAVAWVAHTLAKYAVASERLAAQRGVDLANMAEANRLVIQGMQDGVLVVDERGVVRQFNPAAELLLGYRFPLAGEVGLEQCAPALAKLFNVWRQDSTRKPEMVKLPTGSQVRVRLLPVQRDGFWGALLFLEDMRRIQAQAQQIKLAALGRLTANIAHEVRNPLSAISYATELLHEEKRDPAHERLVQIILDNTLRLNRIVQDVMQLNRRDRAQIERLYLAELLPRFIDEICQAEHASPEIFSLDVVPDCEIGFDRGHFNQVLWNVCGNALRYCQKRPGSVRMRVFTSGGDGGLLMEIKDDGPGVAPETEQQLFEPFFTTEASGTGLGLYIARELCEANGASLEYVRQKPSGACFRIAFGG